MSELNTATMTTAPTDLLTTKQAAALLGIPPTTLAGWRLKKWGPKYIQYRRTVRYSRADVLACLNASVVTTSTSGNQGAGR